MLRTRCRFPAGSQRRVLGDAFLVGGAMARVVRCQWLLVGACFVWAAMARGYQSPWLLLDEDGDCACRREIAMSVRWLLDGDGEGSNLVGMVVGFASIGSHTSVGSLCHNGIFTGVGGFVCF